MNGSRSGPDAGHGLPADLSSVGGKAPRAVRQPGLAVGRPGRRVGFGGRGHQVCKAKILGEVLFFHGADSMAVVYQATKEGVELAERFNLAPYLVFHFLF